jgi:nickel-dependent lactate racemase
VHSKRWPAASEQGLVKAALKKPIGFPKLRNLARGKRRVVVVKKKLRAAGVYKASVKLLVATGLHEGETMSDLRERFGAELLEGLEVTIHDSESSVVRYEK